VETGSYVRGDLAILEAGFAALEQAVLVHDKEGRIVACNRAAAELGRTPVDEILGKDVDHYEQRLRYKDGSPVTRENSRLLRCIRMGQPELNVLVEIEDSPEAATRWVSASYVPLFHEGASDAWGAVSSVLPVPPDDRPRETLNGFSRQLQGMLAGGSALVYLKDVDGRYLFMNRPLGEALGIRRDDAIGKRDDELLSEELAAALIESDQLAIEAGTAIDVEERFETATGVRVLHTVKFPLVEESGDPYAIVGVGADVTELDEAHRELAARLEHAPIPLLTTDDSGRVAHANAEARALGSIWDELQLAIDGREPLADLLDGGDAAMRRTLEDGQRVSLTRSIERPDGGELWLEIEIGPLDGSGAICALRDVTRERERMDELAHLAFHDALTGLPNRRFTEEQLAMGLARARRNRGGVGLVFVDLNGLKAVNDELGHTAGDDVLIEFAERLQAAVRESDAIGRLADPTSTVARRGGDEFVVVLSDLPADCGELVAEIMCRVEAAIEPPFTAAGQELRMSASLGAAAYPYDSHDPATLFEMANAAMRADKRRRQA
jgi:diguanylate cyclase (GGDEF)-like protein/PAS domain S-box-containing protein